MGEAIVDMKIEAVRPPLKMNSVSLNEFEGKMIVIYFYPYDFVAEYAKEILKLADRINDFEDIDCQVLTCSCDSKYVHFAWQTLVGEFTQGVPLLERMIPFPMLGDKTKAFTSIFDLLDKESGQSFPALVILDKEGIIRDKDIVAPPASLDIDDILAKVNALSEPPSNGTLVPPHEEMVGYY